MALAWIWTAMLVLSCAAAMANGRIEAVAQAVFDEHMLAVMQDEAEKQGVIAKAHLKYDTGMGRIGIVGEDELMEFFKIWKK